MEVKPWEAGNVPGPQMADVLDSATAVDLIKGAKRKLLIVGSLSVETPLGEKKLIDYAVKLFEKGMETVATAHTLREFLNRGQKPHHIPLANVIDRLKDASWKGLDGKGPYDLVIFMGIHYPLESQMLSTLKHFAPETKTISFDRQFQPNATLSFPNLGEEKWRLELKKIAEGLK